jgi:hypothetical protein
MSLRSYLFSITAALVVLTVVIVLLRRRRLRERHAVWWLVAGTLALIVGIFPDSLDRAARFLGVGLPANLVFFTSIAVLFLVSLQHSSELTTLETKTRILAEKIALMELESQAGAPDERRGEHSGG